MDPSPIRPDYRKGLAALHAEWTGCTKCPLGEYREEVRGNFVFGEGVDRGIMFIGEGPGAVEEREGRPFVGPSGRVLRHAIEKLGVSRYYITNVVACRSCGPAFDREGNQRMRKNAIGQMVPRIDDKPPTPEQMNACLPRLIEEIYMVDPHIIVALGAQAAKVLARKAISIIEDSTKTMAISIPGAGFTPTLTEKKRVWARKVKGNLVAPTSQNEVSYLMMPLLHPAFVLRKSHDQRWGNPVQKFAEGMRKAAHIYVRHMLEVYGDVIEHQDLTEDDIVLHLQEAHG